ncbi:hypothetical protein [Thalassoroseus pseudoceratinae]|uniref:hypothetical protein n=1 Tax=Thalassoroseus pseudoceratinae TaxID=2713176 RepID=UPI00141E5156|nr:hypothetical protein [Thalassoroseus pseudoceratinae]
MYGSVEQPRRLTDLTRGDTNSFAIPIAGGEFHVNGRVSFAAWACVSIGMAWAIARNGWLGQPCSQSTTAVMEDERKGLLLNNRDGAPLAFPVSGKGQLSGFTKRTDFRQWVWAGFAQTTLTRSAFPTQHREGSSACLPVLRGVFRIVESLPPLGNRASTRFRLVRPSAADDRKQPPILTV